MFYIFSLYNTIFYLLKQDFRNHKMAMKKPSDEKIENV